jgi:hypothetical protein
MARTKLAPILLAIAFGYGSSGAGIADSPLPELVPGKPTLHLYSVAGAIEQGVLSTYVSCTSTDTATV